ncbi:MAG: LCCL domain-containing protein [Acidimicrobiia bacterium]
MAKSRSRRVAVVLILALVGACGGAESGGDSTTEPAPTTTEPAPATIEPAPTTTEPAPTTTETTAVADDAAIRDAWALTGAEHRGEDGEQFTYQCPAAAAIYFYSVWGTDIYTDDSSVCTAGVHAGVITVEDGGDVVIEIRPGEDSYMATTANGVSSGEWGVWSGSFVVVD